MSFSVKPIVGDSNEAEKILDGNSIISVMKPHLQAYIDQKAIKVSEVGKIIYVFLKIFKKSYSSSRYSRGGYQKKQMCKSLN